MGRRRREDGKGLIFHLVNRGTAKRTMFERPPEFRYFESRVAYAVRRQEIEVLCFCLMDNHFHLLVRSLGRLSQAMRRIQTGHSHYFNQSRRRDGPLVTGRFRSFPVDSDAYFLNAYLYIDDNAAVASRINRPEAWPWSSAHLFATGNRPLWLSHWARRVLDIRYGVRTTHRTDPETRATRAALVEARMSRSYSGPDPLDEVLSGDSDRVWRWMLSAAELADGMQTGVPIAGIPTVLRAVEALAPETADAQLLLPNTRRHPFRRILLAGLLRDAAAATFGDIAKAIERSPATARRLHALHLRALREDPTYGAVARALIETCVAPLRR